MEPYESNDVKTLLLPQFSSKFHDKSGGIVGYRIFSDLPNI